MQLHDETGAVFPHDYHFEAGELSCGETPGHGVLPVARLEDGTMWNW